MPGQVGNLLAFGLVIGVGVAPPAWAGGTTERVSVATGGAQGLGDSFSPAISALGRFVAFHSFAASLVPNDTNGRADVFVHDRQAGVTSRVSVATGGAQGTGHSSEPAISALGRFVAFPSRAPDLVPSDTNNREDVFVHTR
jgi:Tol biopolymer transport system component